MYAGYNPNTAEDKIMVGECSKQNGYITRKSYRGLCCIPTEAGGSSTIRYADMLIKNRDTNVMHVRSAGGEAFRLDSAGTSYTNIYNAYTTAFLNATSPLCYFTADPIIPETQSIVQQ